jgi:hypothetical protein
MDSGDLYRWPDEPGILMVLSAALALSLHLRVLAEAATTERPIVSNTVSSKGLVVRIDGSFRTLSGL